MRLGFRPPFDSVVAARLAFVHDTVVHEAVHRTVCPATTAQPLRIHVADGATYKLSHPDFAFVTEGSLILASGPGHELGVEFVVCPLAQIARIEVTKTKTKAV